MRTVSGKRPAVMKSPDGFNIVLFNKPKKLVEINVVIMNNMKMYNIRIIFFNFS